MGLPLLKAELGLTLARVALLQQVEAAASQPREARRTDEAGRGVFSQLLVLHCALNVPQPGPAKPGPQRQLLAFQLGPIP